MSRKRTIFLSIAVLFLLAGGAGWWWVYHQMHLNVTEAELGVEEGFFDFRSVVQLPEMGIDFSQPRPPVDSNTEPSIDNSGNVDQASENASSGSDRTDVAANTPSNSGSDINSSNTSGSQTSSEQSGAQKVEQPLTPEQKLAIIRGEYFNAFTQLQNLALSRIDSLVELAKAEYKNKKDTPGFSKVDLASKYISAGNKLEEEVTKVFYEVLERMKKDLQKNDLPIDLVNEAEKEYRTRIKEKKDELLSKVF